MANGLRLKPGMQCTHSANQEFLKNTSSRQSTVEETLELLQKAKQRVERIFPRRGNVLKRKSRKQKQNRRRADKRKCQRYAENEKSIKRRILKVDEETPNDEDYIIDHEDFMGSFGELRISQQEVIPGAKFCQSINDLAVSSVPRVL